ncbi:hypothetical protein PpBr36_07334 [Pyricularia pennisetigena]|uniref:hypothetical protein n=1 Tax=Pyricularia pennisetigena TaxID=1578925 RepID=UPI00115058A6|nr:hypothetical protein PpBr36_07334 [Pyricularia pennisetigena]TLS25006.1 hypothetical protein PpBr36_07334 [Pyricularia pennisetigena]
MGHYKLPTQKTSNHGTSLLNCLTKKATKEAATAAAAILLLLTIDKTTKTKTAQQLTNKSQDAVEQQTDSGQDLEERLGQQSPKWVELLLGVWHALKLLLGILDALGDGAGQLLEVLRQVVLLGSSFTAGCLVLGVGLDASIGVEATDATVGLGKDLATFLNQGPYVLDKSFLVKLVLGKTYAVDHGADGLDFLQNALDKHAHLLGKLLVLLGLLLLGLLLRGLFLNWLRRDILKQRNVTNGGALAVDDVSIVIDLLARADAEVAAGELANEVAICVDDVTLLVDTTARKRVLLLLDLRLLVAFGVAKDVSVLVAHIAIFIDATTGQCLAVALGQATDNIAAWGDDHTIFADSETLELGEGTFLGALTLALGHNLGAADNVAALAENVALLVAHTADHALGVALNNAAEDGTAAVNDVAGLDVAVGVNLHAAELLDVALDDLADLLFVEYDHTFGVDGSVGEGLERAGFLGHGLKLVLGNRLGPTNDLATVVPDGALLVDPLADEVGHNALFDTANDLAVAVDDVAALIDLATLEDREVDLVGLLLNLLTGLVELLFTLLLRLVNLLAGFVKLILASFCSFAELLLAVLGGVVKLIFSIFFRRVDLFASLVELLLTSFGSLVELPFSLLLRLVNLLAGLVKLLLASFCSFAELLLAVLGGVVKVHLAGGLVGLAPGQTCSFTDLASGIADFASGVLGDVADLAGRILSGLRYGLSGITQLTGDLAERALVLVQGCQRVVAASVLGGLLDPLRAGLAHGLGLNLIKVVLVHVDTAVAIAFGVDIAIDLAINSATRVDGILRRQLLGRHLVIFISRQILLGPVSDL